MFLGTSSIVHEKTHEPLLSILSLIVETAVRLVQDGHRVAIVSSGAIGMGLRRMDVAKRPKSLTARQVSGQQALGNWREWAERTKGSGKRWAMSIDRFMEYVIWASPSTHCSNPPHQERHCRSHAVPQCSEYLYRAVRYGRHPNRQ